LVDHRAQIFVARLIFMGVEIKDEAVVVVDPYSSGPLLVDELHHRGFPVVAVRTSLNLSEAVLETWNSVSFERVIVHRGDVMKTLAALQREGRVKAVIAGSEYGVELADELANAMGLRGNAMELSACRRDKYKMQERLRECGLRSCIQRCCISTLDASDFAREVVSWPLIVKPCVSTGIEHIYKCETEAALAEAVLAVLGSKDSKGSRREAALVQVFLEGTEFLVDCVSFDGRHFVSAIWEHQKKHSAGFFACDRIAAVPYCDQMESDQAKIRDYVFSCLTALGVKNGPSQCKVMFSQTTGPCLIEAGARMHSSIGPALWATCAGKEQAQPFLVADVFTQNGREITKKMEAVAAGAVAYKLEQSAMLLDLHCHSSGFLEESIQHCAGKWLAGLPTFFEARYFVEEGDRLTPTINVSTSPGYIVLIGPNEAVKLDAKAIREAELSGSIYKLKDVEPTSDIDPGSKAIALNTAPKLRQVEPQVSGFLSPMASPAASPCLSPAAGPLTGPDFNLLDDDFMLDDGEDEFVLEGLPAGVVDVDLPLDPQLILAKQNFSKLGME